MSKAVGAGPGVLCADWPAPAGVHALTTLRQGGESAAPYAQWNLADQVGDDPAQVARNRKRLKKHLSLPSKPVWLQQVHGCGVVRAERVQGPVQADGSYTHEPGIVCAVLTADCLPVLLCSHDGRQVAAVHAGWRGLVAGVIEVALETFQDKSPLVWLGPAIGPAAFEVGEEVRNAFLAQDPATLAAFQESRAGHWYADLYGLARMRLARRGVDEVYGGDHCTLQEAEQFYSYRRDGVTGRMASLIWRES